ncbi:phenylacetaldoxime dehydratase family protein [Acinetobacter nectaris]|uniref:aliphatic aldoxime dehydratase n=1 Tax=Acinetobacter nectaris TaxID=1219382 RepID=UPI001F2F0090|nr:phenylacetaldoxime dehydratase family protein [Acinetobacter nectaris]MCF8999177.1 phenylacetaldoxime dehydratase family protein [Acinetobacter nectaris]MCF9026498.1 phenylacetaldoxime dehydratase family protein [Acinetobacter nectaris]
MESAIAQHLKCPRTLSRRIHDEYEPPFSMWVGRAKEDLSQVVMAYLGIQFKQNNKAKALEKMQYIVGQLGEPFGTKFYDLNHHTDNKGYENYIIVAYWSEPEKYLKWSEADSIKDWWESEDRLNDGVGYFKEVMSPRSEQFETLYAFKEDFPGVGALMSGISDDIQEHGYWGSARDRFPISQTSRMLANGKLQIISGNPHKQGRVIIQGHDNITLIRSGQDWANADQDERDLYFNEMLPPLQDGMDFLRDHGRELGCYSNRFVRSVDINGNLLDLAYDIGHWRSLDLLERWAESHPTHLRIFTTFFKVVTGLQNLKLYHEISVCDGQSQWYEYINCHESTGMMRDAITE